MDIGQKDLLQKIRQELNEAEAELGELQKQLRIFEAQVDTRLGKLLDQLSDLNAETMALDKRIREIREQRLFGTDLMQYLDGAPRPVQAPKLNDLPPVQLSKPVGNDLTGAGEVPIPDIKLLYRKLARRHHPDLARSDADRIQSTVQMAEINRAYNEGDLSTLMRLDGVSIPYGVDISRVNLSRQELYKGSMTEAEQISLKLNEVRQQILHLGNLSIVKLSLDVKLARHQGRDLLNELVSELHYKVRRKTAERDYLLAQIRVSGE